MKDLNITLPQRKRNRLDGYDYSSAGAYFVTICTSDRACLFGHTQGGEMRLNTLGRIAKEEWLRTAQMRPNVILDCFVVMPNHVHGVIAIDYSWFGHRKLEDAKQSVGRIVAGFKAACVRRIRESAGTGTDCTALQNDVAIPLRVWQKSFHDEIIRDDRHLNGVREYIINNPAQWELDLENPERILKK